MILQQLLGDQPLAEFINEHYLRFPHSSQGGAANLAELGTWDVVGDVLASPGADALVVRQGERWPEERVPAAEEARQLFADGYTILVRHAERHHPELAQLAEAFRQDLGGEVDVHIYCTPGGQFGFGWHYDAEDVFILQTQGKKEYSLRKNTVNPWPLAETLPVDMRYEREIMPLFRCQLAAGDWLYIPNGYWHKADAEEDSISLAVGVLSVAALDVLDFLRTELLDSFRWRQRLPTPGEAGTLSPEEMEARYGEIFCELGDDLARLFKQPGLVQRFLAAQGASGGPSDRSPTSSE